MFSECNDFKAVRICDVVCRFEYNLSVPELVMLVLGVHFLLTERAKNGFIGAWYRKKFEMYNKN